MNLPSTLVRAFTCFILTVFTFPVASAQTPTPSATFSFAPRCASDAEESSIFGALPLIDFMVGKPLQGTCPPFTVTDRTLETSPLRVGDTLDVDLVLQNPNKEAVQRIRAWIAYDPTVLSGTLLQISPLFPSVTASEKGFSSVDGYAKIAARANDAPPLTADVLHVARLRFTVLGAKSASTVLSFYNAKGDTRDHTAAVSGKGKDERSILSASQPSLLVRLQGEAASASTSVSSSSASSTVVVSTSLASSSSVATTTSASLSRSSTTSTTSSLSILTLSSASSASQQRSAMGRASGAFGHLQVSGLDVATQGASIQLSWSPLQSREVTGYHLYYGTTPGTYTQRRALTATTTSDIISQLPVGQRYYLALRALSTEGESAYSPEVSVVVGQPQTATTGVATVVPPSMTGHLPTLPLPSSSPRVAGETGPQLWFALCLGSGLAAVQLLTRRRSSSLL